MNAQLIICDKVIIDKENKFITLGKVLNHVEVETFPYIYNINIFIKLFEIPNKDITDIQIGVYNQQGTYYAFSSNISVHNMRYDDQIPGVDLSIILTTTFIKEEILFIKLFVDQEEMYSYPLTIRVKDNLFRR